eukprot:gnl/MRDRNA2_/MRDRNA2_74362_c0_seq1.p1 gnl/MRDRNA2_/MRDRNA2_74362_c0~~gnl/MRDRNA2_/MRDRNA2_74362_c0_seq1.p1  ORF type:complete len:364 (-),score=41.58 gnl/MRDRNA2_/MRDRNA2_74362_c0_seq1:33-1124(-)
MGPTRWIGALATLWVAVRSISACGLLFIPVPLLGYLRADVAVPILMLSSLIAWVIFGSRFKIIRLLGSCLLFFGVFYSKFTEPQQFFLQGTIESKGLQKIDITVTEDPGALDAGTCDAMIQAAWDHRSLWVKYGESAALAYLGFGRSINFDRNQFKKRLPWWTFYYGFRDMLGHNGDFILNDEFEQKELRSKIKLAFSSLPWFSNALRKSLARALEVDESHIILGGEPTAEDLSHPNVQIYLPSLAWHSIVNIHNDMYVAWPFKKGRKGEARKGKQCDRSTFRSFLWPLNTPPGAGLLWWTVNETGIATEHESLYEKGNLYTFHAALPHSIRPWPYREWAAHEPRMTVQAFGILCGDDWYVYH